MKPETQATIREIMTRIVSSPIPVSWRSRSVLPGAGERKSASRGSSGYDVVARVEYEPGDDPRDIDWAATAQTGGQNVLTTQYAEPREIKIFVLVDTNPSMSFGTARTTKRLLAAELTACIIKSAEETHDKVGFIAYSDHAVETFLTARTPQRALMPALANLVELEGTTPGAGSGLCKAEALLPKNRSLVFILSDFSHLEEAEKNAIKRMGLTHDVVCVNIQDRRERELPSGFGVYTFKDLRTGERISIWLSPTNRRLFAENHQRRQEALFAFLKEAHCDRAVFSTEEGDAAITKIMRLFAGHRR